MTNRQFQRQAIQRGPEKNILVAPCGLRYVEEYYKDPDTGKEYKYKLLSSFRYYSERYDKYVTLRPGYRSDGATGAFDIASCAWWVHDKLCDDGTWDDGTPLTNWQCSRVLSDILYAEGRWVRSKRWFWATFLLGGGAARDNGMFRLS